MHYFKYPMLFAGPLFLSACAGTVLENYSNNQAGFDVIATETSKAIGKTTSFAQTQGETRALQTKVRKLLRGKVLNADNAVQVALFNNKGLQASYANVGLSAADAWQEATPENPIVSIGVFGGGAAELTYLAIEGLFRANILDVTTRKKRLAVADAAFRKAQQSAINDTLSLAYTTRVSWINTVAAYEAVHYLTHAKQTSDAGSELALKLGETGALNKAGQAREQAFNAELAGQLAQARLNAARAKEELTRLLGLWGEDTQFSIPNKLPVLPSSIKKIKNIEVKALNNRVDLRLAQLQLQVQAAAFGLTNQTRLVSDLELVAGVDMEREVGSNGDIEKVYKRKVELEFAIPIFDSGNARRRKAELSYLQAANIVAEKAVNARSEVREAEMSYFASYQIAKHYRDVVVPLRTTVEEEGLLSYNGMITNTFELLTDVREKLAAQQEAANAKRDFYLAQAELTAAIYGGGAGGASAGEGPTIAGGGAGH